MALSLFLAGFSVPFVRTLASQVRLMVPQLDSPLDGRVYESALRAIAAEPEILAVRRALQLAARGRIGEADLAVLDRDDPGNGLRSHLVLLAGLRQEDEAGATQPAGQDERVRDLLLQVRHGPPVRLYATRQRELALAALRQAGVPPRRAVLEADRMRQGFKLLRESHRPVVRELADRLVAKGDAWRDEGRVDDARAAHAVVVRLLIDLVDDSPTPDVALLAAERLPAALNALAADATADVSASHDDPGSLRPAGVAHACRAAAGEVASFRDRWHAADPDARANLIPHTGDVILARRAHDRVLGCMVAAAAALIAWLTVAAMCLVWLIAVAISRPPGSAQLVWRFGGRSMWVSPFIVCAAPIVLLVAVSTARPDFAWLISYPSLAAAAVWPVLTVTLTGLATWACVRPTGEAVRSLIPVPAVAVATIVPLATILLGGLLLPVDAEAWRPPPGIQRFRSLGPVIGLECVAIMVLWVLWGSFRRRRAGLARGAWARANLAVCSTGLLAATVLTLAVLGVNHHLDNQHRVAFVEAADYPIADRLGPNWRQDHFDRVRAVLDIVE